MTDVHLLLLAAFLTWFSLMLASSLRSRLWTPEGSKIAFGNRDHVPAPSPLAARADRAAKNLVENMPIFIAVVLAARFAGAPPEAIAPWAHLFVWARVVYLAVYLAGVPYLRTLVFGASIAGIAMIATVALHAARIGEHRSTEDRPAHPLMQ
jgi:uncharacterized MAPEG superfamily protein